ncbi:hypothetical protein CTAYLR_000189 [Chrysophaeum taylorii]|uniref:Conserved oligomeric Golgi complex subunit 5 n=1 Tax=Chrysophaeum taylorii TaxID=2483200 RepID=A0AAD7XL30_9STRA|nr:hypothetical protein CTAYLR_000189 [Chrysophaeum taylorii]
MRTSAEVLLAQLRDDPVYGSFASEDFDVAAFAKAVIERDAKEETYAEGVLAELGRRAGEVDTAIEAHVSESREVLLKGAKSMSALRRDVEAVEFATRDVRRRAKNMARKLIDPYEVCARKTTRLRTVFEANEVLRRSQRAIFSLRRLREKVAALDRGDDDLREMAKAAALVREIEGLVEGDGARGAASLASVTVLSAEISFVGAARERLRASGADALDAALRATNQIDVAAALSLSHELGLLRASVDAAVERLAEGAADAAKAALSGESDALDRGTARALADDWARAIENLALQAAILDRVLRKPREGGRLWDVVSDKGPVVDRAWTAASKSILVALRSALELDAEAAAPPNEEDKDDGKTKDEGHVVEGAKPTDEPQHEESNNANKPPPPPQLSAIGTAKLAELSKAAKSLLDETTQRSKRMVESSKMLVEQSSKLLVEQSKRMLPEQLSSVRKLTTALVAHYPVVRKSFLTMTARFGGPSSTAAPETSGEEQGTDIIGIDPHDPLGSVAKLAPPRSFVALCEAQFKEIFAAHEETCYATSRKPDAAKRRAARAFERASLAPLPTRMDEDDEDEDVQNGALPYSVEVVKYAQQLDSAVVKHRIEPYYAAARERPFGLDPKLFEELNNKKKQQLEEQKKKQLRAADDQEEEKKKKKKSSDDEAERISGKRLDQLVLEALGPLCDGYLHATGQRLLEPVVLMFPEVEGYEAALPSKHDAARLVAAARKELRDVLEEGGEVTLVPAVLDRVSQACEEFGRRATRALKVKPARERNFESLTEAVDRAAKATRAARSSVAARRLGTDDEPRRPGEIRDVRWRANATEEHDAQIASLCAQLETSLSRLRQLLPADFFGLDDDDDEEDDAFEARLRPGMAALEAVCERVSFVSLDAVAFRVELELARAHVDDYSVASDEMPSQSLERALAALEAARVGYCAALPFWHSPGQFDSPSSRASVLALAARVARAFVSHVALYRPLSGDGRLRVATDAAALDNALAQYEPDALPPPKQTGGAPRRHLASERAAALALERAREELAGLKRFLFAAEDGAAVVTMLAEGAKLIRPRGPLRPSTVWHHVLASRGRDALPLPHDLAEPERGGGSQHAYVAWLVAGPHPWDQDSPADQVTREGDAWRDVLRCLDSWAQRASATGVTNLGEVYDALQTHGAPLLSSYKRALEATNNPV